jgi:peptidoglycan/xylan/chitin deacetylase (PgdA/CDA1 family)
MATGAEEPLPGPPRDLVGYGVRIPRVVWPDDAKVAVSLVVNYEEGSEHYRYAGDPKDDGLAEINYALDPEFRDFARESVYEYGSRAGIWRLLRIFDEYALKATFFACGMALERNPDLGEAIGQARHEPCAHGYRWSEPWHYSRKRSTARSSSRSTPFAARAARGRTAGTGATARPRARASSSSRRGSSMTRTPTTTTSRT